MLVRSQAMFRSKLTLKDGAAIAGNRMTLLTEVLAGDVLKGNGLIKPGKTEKTVRQATWGARNTASIGHPIGMAVPALKSWLSAPADQLAGDANMPRVAGPTFGQSERMTVSPGREEEGLYNMPGGQSGHPLSPFFLAGHKEWAGAEPVPLLPGAARYTLKLVP